MRQWYRCPFGGDGKTIDGVGIQKETHSLTTFTSCLAEMKEWLLTIGATHIEMENID